MIRLGLYSAEFARKMEIPDSLYFEMHDLRIHSYHILIESCKLLYITGSNISVVFTF